MKLGLGLRSSVLIHISYSFIIPDDWPDTEVMIRLNSMSTTVLEMFSISRVEIKLSSWLVVIKSFRSI